MSWTSGVRHKVTGFLRVRASTGTFAMSSCHYTMPSRHGGTAARRLDRNAGWRAGAANSERPVSAQRLPRDVAYVRNRSACQALEAGHLDRVEPALRLFFCLPFAHSEKLSDQEISVLLNAKLGQPWLEHAEGHRDIIRHFGRFPHRNPILGRTMTPEEADFLKDGGYQG